MKKIIIFFIVYLCLISFNVYAETGTVQSSDGINIREQPTTSSEILKSIANNTKFYISNLNGGTGTGCDGPWYYIYYQEIYGYVCSLYVEVAPDEPTTTSTSYDRPWTTPKKSIVGGAKFIATSYIAKGQYTSYLKKYNVNPESYYAKFTNQYMANLRAPASESITTYNSLSKNGLLNNAFNFIIPVFLDMPNSTYNSSISNTGVQSADVQNQDFENKIASFPESYKPYLRYLYTKHRLWTYTPLITNLDFNYSVTRQKAVSSINYSSNLCEQPIDITEGSIAKGNAWCITTTETMAFYLDPRNFLSEKYIFMFENLSYSDLYTEKIAQAALDGTFMQDHSFLDNQSYASIFVEAGKTAGVSPLYLAVLARQESGVKMSFTTSGEQFEYQGSVYHGLYNFFNIGASSSEGNPAKAGLIYANGGQGYNNGGITDNNILNHLSKLQLSSTGRYVKGYAIGTIVSSIKNKADSETNIIIKSHNGVEKTNNDPIATGDIIQITTGEIIGTYSYIMLGDINGDGQINSADLLSIRQHLLGINILKDAYLASAFLTNNNEVNSADLLKMRQYLLGLTTINQ